ncbi:ParB/RepB/Spo0J family partition protein [Acidocella sp.]|uniref:ParB/RepB/Spo0J family partition protein n=1 Tax=Acidocella sp. TaxID=50710 RepID=UPI0026086D32|nr:ParB/RepB/Spo0J family partition protein [Acidocella sp.]
MNVLREEGVSLELIDVEDRLRDIDEDKVSALALSMAERGQLQPIELREKAGGRYRLNIGAHRYAAAQKLGWFAIKAVVVECSDEEARLREIDENLFRHELSPFDQANFIEERRQIWERLNGQIKRGGDRRSKGQIVPLIEGMMKATRSSFLKDTAQKFGLPTKTIQRALTRKATINPKVWEVLRHTEAANNGSLLDKIRKLHLDEQFEVAAMIKDRGCTVQYAIRAVVAPSDVDAEAQAFAALCRAWERAGETTRAKFLKQFGAKK